MYKIICNGTVGNNPEHKVVGEYNFAVFSLAVKITKEKTDWVDINVNGKLKDIVLQHVIKGSKVIIEGSPKANAYINKENKAVGKLVIYANSIEFFGDKKEVNNDDVPF